MQCLKKALERLSQNTFIVCEEIHVRSILKSYIIIVTRHDCPDCVTLVVSWLSIDDKIEKLLETDISG